MIELRARESTGDLPSRRGKRIAEATRAVSEGTPRVLPPEMRGAAKAVQWLEPSAPAARPTLVRVWEHDLASGCSRWEDDLIAEAPVTSHEGDTYEAFLRRHVHPDDVERVLSAFRAADQAQRPFEARYRMTHPSGLPRIVLDRARFVCAADGRARKLVGTCRDITQAPVPDGFAAPPPRESLDELEQACLQGRLVHRNGLPLYVNRRMVELLGYEDVEDFLASARLERLVVTEPQGDAAAAAGAPMPRGSEPLRRELRVRRKDGSTVRLDTLSAPVRWEGMPAAQLTVVETTAHGPPEEPPRAPPAEAADWLAGELAHELNNVLLIVSGHATLLLEASDPGDRAAAKLTTIVQAATRGSQLVRKLLAAGRNQPLVLEPVQVNRIIETVIDLMQDTGDGKHTFQFAPDVMLRPALGDAAAMEQILINLYVNARDAMPDGGCVRLRAAHVDIDPVLARAHGAVAPGAYVRISVSDAGTGMSQEVQQRLFEPYFSTKSSERGSGLGMTVVRSLVQRQRGFLHIESRPGDGTDVHVFLPVAQPRPAAEARRQKRTVLLVEPDPMAARLIARILDDMDVSAFIARDGAGALALYEEHAAAVELVLLNLTLPGTQRGPEVYARLQERKPALPVLFLVNAQPELDMAAFILRTGRRFVCKPCRMDELTIAVEQSLDRTSAA
jgi:signal transduction histidine kinase